MERHDVLELMGQLKLAGMRAAYDEIVGAGVKRKHAIGRIVGDLLAAEVADKKARSIGYRLSTAKLPMAKDLSDFDFKASPVNEALVRELNDGGFVHSLRNAVLLGGTGTGKTHLAVAITANCIRNGAKARFFNVVDLVNRLEADARDGKAGRLADQLADRSAGPRRARLPALRQKRRAIIIPSHQPALRTNLGNRHHEPVLQGMAVDLHRPENDNRPARSPDPPLRHPGDRKPKLALQEPLVNQPAPPRRPGCPGGSTGTPHASSLRAGANALHEAARVPPMDYRDNLHRAKRGVNIGRR